MILNTAQQAINFSILLLEDMDDFSDMESVEEELRTKIELVFGQFTFGSSELDDIIHVALEA